MKTSAPDDKKDQQQNHAKPTGSVHEIQTEAAPIKGRRRRGGKGRPDSSQNEPQFQAANNTGYQQAIQGGPSEPQQQQRSYPPPPPPPPQYSYWDMPRYNLCSWAPNLNAYTNFQPNNYSAPNNYPNYQLNSRSSFPPNYASGPNECFPNSALRSRSFLVDLECYNWHQKGHFSRDCQQPHAQCRNLSIDSTSQIALAATTGQQATVAGAQTAAPPAPPAGHVGILNMQQGGPVNSCSLCLETTHLVIDCPTINHS